MPDYAVANPAYGLLPRLFPPPRTRRSGPLQAEYEHCGNGRPSPIGMEKHRMTSDLPVLFETVFLQQPNHFLGFEVRELWAHTATTIFSERISG